jgi:3-oxoacyl-[acyl-carrier protein] reductase
MGIFHCCRAVVPQMRPTVRPHRPDVFGCGQGRQSDGVRLQRREGGRDGADESLGKELAGENIAVNAITPTAATRIFDQISDQHIAYMLSKIPAGASSSDRAGVAGRVVGL